MNATPLKDPPKKVTGFGVELRLMEEADIPLVCEWRNHPDVRPYMDDTREVTPNIMRFWFNKIKNSMYAYPFIIRVDGEPRGYIDIKNINYEFATYGCGIFISPAYHGQRIGYRAILCHERAVRALGMKTYKGKVRKINHHSINFCTKWGCKFTDLPGDWLYYTATWESRDLCLSKLASDLNLKTEYDYYFNSVNRLGSADIGKN